MVKVGLNVLRNLFLMQTSVLSLQEGSNWNSNQLLLTMKLSKKLMAIQEKSTFLVLWAKQIQSRNE